MEKKARSRKVIAILFHRILRDNHPLAVWSMNYESVREGEFMPINTPL